MDLESAKHSLLSERADLTGLRDSLTGSRELDVSQQESSGELSSHDQHPGDQASGTFQRERDLSIEEGLTTKLGEIDAALDRIENGEYGRCQVCGRQIDDERLAALPATRFCREHAEDGRIASGNGDTEITQELGPAD